MGRSSLLQKLASIPNFRNKVLDKTRLADLNPRLLQTITSSFKSESIGKKDLSTYYTLLFEYHQQQMEPTSKISEYMIEMSRAGKNPSRKHLEMFLEKFYAESNHECIKRFLIENVKSGSRLRRVWKKWIQKFVSDGRVDDAWELLRVLMLSPCWDHGNPEFQDIVLVFEKVGFPEVLYGKVAETFEAVMDFGNAFKYRNMASNVTGLYSFLSQ